MFKFHGYSGPCPKPALLQPHQQRVVQEKTELDSKMDKLSAFVDTPVFASLPEAEKERLARQLYHMGQYREVLFERIAAFE